MIPFAACPDHEQKFGFEDHFRAIHGCNGEFHYTGSHLTDFERLFSEDPK
jgi:hypothetical protein